MKQYATIAYSVLINPAEFLRFACYQLPLDRTDREPLEQYISFRVRDIAAPLLPIRCPMVLSIENSNPVWRM